MSTKTYGSNGQHNRIETYDGGKLHMIGIIAKLGRWEATEKMRAKKTRS